MTRRRDFLKSTTKAALVLPFTKLDTKKYSFETLSNSLLEGEDYWKLVRKQFPLKEGLTYFNNGTMGPSPSYVLDKMIHHMTHYNTIAATIDYKDGSGPALLSGYFPYIGLREKLGAIINADYKEVSLTQNATHGMNIVGNGLDLQKGDEIINTNQEHGGGFGAWRLLARRRGCVYKEAIMPEPANDPQEVVDAIFKVVTSKTKVIAVPHMISGFGTVMPVKEICAEARKRGIFTVLDGAQCVGHVKVDVKDIDCDAYYSSLHKWLLAPAGSGLLYINKDVVGNVWTTLASYQWDNDEDNGFRLMQSGTGNPALLVGYEAAVDFYNTIGEDRWLNRIKELGMYLRAGLKEMNHVTIYSSTNEAMAAGITTYSVEGVTGPDLQKTMWEKERLQPRSVGEQAIRHSTHIYNSKEEIEKALKVISSLA